MSGLKHRRLEKELGKLRSSPPEGIEIDESAVPAGRSDEAYVWIHGAPGSLYEDETFRVRFRFSDQYPVDSPEVVFVGSPPRHPHVYSNGHICLSTLYDEWSPVLTVASVCISLQSMLSSATEKVGPADDARYVSMVGYDRSPKLTRWDFHDDKC
eukprot:EC794473.1.p2 GENE.EC794473.1~~EC794473.1.p2  ORF type:complete len:155 (+),score=44.52 EC794473.1:77-541(+)